MPQSAPSTIRGFLDAITASVPADPDKKRYLIVAVCLDPYLDDKGRYRHRRREEQAFLWPARRDGVVDLIEHWGQRGDVYACPYLQKTSRRHLGNAAWRQLIHSDVDGGDADELRAKVRKLGGFIVWSGSNGHAHVYVPLSYTIRQAQHERLCEGLRDYLAGDSKIRENDLMRVPGSYNHKPTLQGLPAVLVKAEKP